MNVATENMVSGKRKSSQSYLVYYTVVYFSLLRKGLDYYIIVWYAIYCFHKTPVLVFKLH